METNGKFKILVVDDEPSITTFIQMGLSEKGFAVEVAGNGLEALSKAGIFQPHLVILDVMMPGLDGYEVCQMLKESIDTTVIFLSAKDEIDDRVKGLDLGADDYLIKPFSFKELLSRIRARLRSHNDFLRSVRIGPFVVDDDRHEISCESKLLELSPTEYALLRYLLTNHGIVLSKRNILENVWGYDFLGEDNIVEVYISYLREKLGDKARRIIRTIRGVGYRVDV